MSAERWVPIPEYEEFYEVSSEGRLRRLVRSGNYMAGTYLKPYLKPPHGYPYVSLSDGSGKKKWFFVHRLVALAFLGPEPDGMEVCHYNGDPTDARVENLRWDTHGENLRDAVRHGTHSQSSKTHCKYGHKFTEENTRIEVKASGGSKRTCLECEREAGRQKYARAHPNKGNVPRKTHCKNGHEFTPENTVVNFRPDGQESRSCKQCRRDAGRRYYQRKTGKASYEHGEEGQAGE